MMLRRISGRLCGVSQDQIKINWQVSKSSGPDGFLRRWYFVFMLLSIVNLCQAGLATKVLGDANFIFNNPTKSSRAGNIVIPVRSLSLVTPSITVRLANPQYSCATAEYCLDVEFQSDIEDQELFAMNVRFFYEDNILELINFTDFQGGYGPIAPNPPTVLTSSPSFGNTYFGFGVPGNSAADFVNGAIQLLDENQPPILISTTGWTKLFQICFHIDDPNPDSLSFCPPIVWDLEQDPANGGYLTGDDGVVLTVTTSNPGVSAPAFEQVEQFNWVYTGDGMAPPYGEPMEMSCIAILIDATINGSTQPGCYYTNRIFQPMQPELPGVTYEWDFGYGAIPANGIGYGPFTVYYDTAGTKTVTLVISPTGVGPCADSASIQFVISSCPANILGNVKSIMEVPISGVNLRLYADANTDGIADNSTIIKNVFSTSIGNFSMASITPGHYVIVEIQPTGWYSMDDGDPTEDGDVVENIDSLDNLIPVSLLPGEIDMINYFIEAAIPGNISGNVFNDFDLDQSPDSGEELPNVIIGLYADNNADGIADTGTPISTQVTLSIGSYQFANVPVGNYVLIETNPAGYVSVKDFDASNDADIVPNTNMVDDTIPVTITNNEIDANNYFIDVEDCSLLVTNTNDNGIGSLRYAINCAEDGDTIKFHSILAGATIIVNSNIIEILKDIVILSTVTPKLTIASSIAKLFEIEINAIVEFRDLNMVSGLPSVGEGAAFENYGILKLYNAAVIRNPLFTSGQYLIRNHLNAELIMSGNCFLEMD